jgi:hypothetical protein
MSELRELQREMLAGLVNPAATAYTRRLRAVRGIGAESRLAIYRNNIEQGRIQALQLTYPVVLRLVGEDCFRQFARAYACATPSRSGNLDDYGASFAGFLVQHEHFHGLPYLADVATLEWLLHEVHQASAPVRLSDDALQSLASADPESVSVGLDPSCRLFTSPFPVHRIWQMNQSNHTPELMALDDGAVRLLVVQHDWQVMMRELGPGEYAFAGACERGLSLLDACDAALECEATLDLGRCLHQFIHLGALTHWYECSATTTREKIHARR